jgi:lipoyltransferase/lipoate-protein ligase
LGRTVVMGRNQVAHQEVNLDFCRENHIDVIRRKSGGGAIFADDGNIMISLVTTQGKVEPIFLEYATTVSRSLNELGAQTEVHGRNDDILMGKGKVCGNAFYHKTGHNIAHGTMLYDTNARLMEGALRPDIGKLEQKGVKSVRSRVGLLKDYLSFGVGTLRQRLRLLLCNRSTALSDADVQQIELLEQRYCQPDYFYGSTLRSDVVRSRRIAGCGLVELHFRLSGSRVADVALHGDFFDLGQAGQRFASAFVGCPFTPDSLRRAIAEHHPECAVRGLSEEAIVSLLTNSLKKTLNSTFACFLKHREH